MHDVAKTALASRDQAVKFSKIIISSYPPYQRQGDHQAYLAAFIEVLTGQPMPILEAMVNPRTGLTRRLKWLPSISEVMDFIENWHRRYKVTEGAPLSFPDEKFYDRNGREIKGHVYQAPTPEERERNYQRMKDLSRTIKETAEAMQRANPKRLKPIQYAGPEMDRLRMEALKNLEAINSLGDSMSVEDD